jgi:hypothetical protein
MGKRKKKCRRRDKRKTRPRREKEIKTSFCGEEKINFYSMVVNFWGEKTTQKYETRRRRGKKEKRNKIRAV